MKGPKIDDTSQHKVQGYELGTAHLNVVSLVVITALSEQSVRNCAIRIQSIKYWICVLERAVCQYLAEGRRDSRRTLLKLAVNTTTS